MHKLSVTIALLAIAPAAHAYLDPSTGSMIISAFVGLVASVALAIKTYWYRLKAFFSRKTGKADAGSDDPAA